MDIRIKKVKEHYELYSNNKFICSCDNMTEVNEEIKLIEKEEFGDEVCE